MNNPSIDDHVKRCLEKLSDIYSQQVILNQLSPIGGGSISQTFRLTSSAGQFFLKLNFAGIPAMFRREAEGLQALGSAEKTGLVIPKVYWHEDEKSVGLLLTEYLSPAKSISGMDENLGRGLARLHQKTSPTYGFAHSNYCGTTVQENKQTSSWADFYLNNRILPLLKEIRALRGLSAGDSKIYEKLCDRLPGLLAHPTVPSLIHGDLWSGNFLYSENGPALIDPACYYADREMELAMMKLFGGFSPTVWRAYQDEFPLPDEWESRVALYQLYHILNHYLMFGGSYGFQAVRIASSYL